MSDKILSIFIDESGDFGEYDAHCPYYLVTMVMHDQGISIQDQISDLHRHVDELGFPPHAIHTAPLIRENRFMNMSG